jgi:ribosomal protein L23
MHEPLVAPRRLVATCILDRCLPFAFVDGVLILTLWPLLHRLIKKTGPVGSPKGFSGEGRLRVFTEKSLRLLGKNQYTFNVESRFTKTEIKHWVELFFGVKVVAVNSHRLPGKGRRMERKSLSFFNRACPPGPREEEEGDRAKGLLFLSALPGM